jgi:hypothetical protein
MDAPSPPATRSGAEAPPAKTSGAAAPARFDRKFIEDHGLVDRYLAGTLPLKGAVELEAWCRNHPEYLEELKLSERATASLRLLEEVGRPADLTEPKTPWWKTLYFVTALAVLALVSLVGFLAAYEKYVHISGQLADARQIGAQGSLAPPGVERPVRLEPDHGPGLAGARVNVTHTSPALVQLQLDMNYVRETAFRLVVDKRDQGRALIVENLTKDSNGNLKLAFNSSGLTPGSYDVRIEGMPLRGAPIAEGWLTIEAH